MSVGQTITTIADVIDHAVRRAEIPIELQTPETVETAKRNLHFILSNLPNLGMNYWALDEQLINLEEGKIRYVLPSGTVDIQDANYRIVTEVTGTDSTTSTEFVTEFSESTNISMLFVDSTTSSLTISKSDDGVSYTTVRTISHSPGKAWYVLDGVSSKTFLKISNAVSLTVSEVRWVSSYRDTPLYRMNRNDYMAFPDKNVKGRPLQYWFDRQTSPEMVLWAAPDSTAASNLIQLYRHRQIADVGALNETLELPQRWYEAIVWQLALNTATETPGVKPERIQLCATMAQNALGQVQNEERDNSPISFTPNIGVYTS